MQTKLLSYLRKMDNENPIIRDLLRKILVLNPNKRSSIEQILKHKYFDEYRVKNFDNKRKLTKFLRGNYNLMDPRTVIDALKMDLIGMKAGQQIFQLLNTPILLQKQFSFWQRIFRVNMPCAYVLVGGGRYFKLKNPLNEKYFIA